MSFTVSLHKDPDLTGHQKHRNNFTAGALFTTTAVNIGNFSNLNLFCDNSVELACGQETPPISTYERATEANYIKIVWGAYTVIGFITDWDYINDGNVKISYNVDAYTSAKESGLIQDATGICERVNMLLSGMRSNLQSEPFSASDTSMVNSTLTQAFNALAASLEGMTPSWDGINDANTSLILTVSPAIVEYLGIGQFGTPPTSITAVLKNRANMSFYAADVTSHAGGTYRGTPLKFSGAAAVQDCFNFIKNILAGCGFRTQLSANGAQGQNAVSYNSYITDANTGAGQSNWQYRNSSGEPMESIRFITIQDIYNLYCIPTKFATPIHGYPNELQQIRGFKSLGNLHRWGGEDTAKYKLLSHPFYYSRVITANGDTVNIIPQGNWYGDNISTFINVWVRYVGGDTPKIQGMIANYGTGQGSPIAQTMAAEWFTVRNYPAVTLSINDSYNPQIQKDVANTRKVAATYANSAANARLTNPVKQGYLDTVTGYSNSGGAHSGMGNQGTGGYLMSFLGKGLGAIEGGNHEAWGNLYQDKNRQAADNAAREASAGNFISAEMSSIMGNDFMAQFSVPAFAVFDCGASDTEQFTFSRYIDDFGNACNCIINPITNAGNVLGGEGVITPVNQRTFYQFSNITIKGNMPIEWKIKIKSLFESGVYLLEY